LNDFRWPHTEFVLQNCSKLAFWW